MDKALRGLLCAPLVLLVGAGVLPGCGEIQDPDVPRAAPPGPTGPKDPDQALKEAPVPPPRSFQESDLWYEASGAGTFANIPPAKLESLPGLLETFVALRAKAAEAKGESVVTPAGPSYEPTTAEVELAEAGARIEHVLRGAPPGQVRSLWARSQIKDASLTWITFRVVTAKVMGTGFVEVIEVETRQVERPKR